VLLKDEVPMKWIGHQANRLNCQRNSIFASRLGETWSIWARIPSPFTLVDDLWHYYILFVELFIFIFSLQKFILELPILVVIRTVIAWILIINNHSKKCGCRQKKSLHLHFHSACKMHIVDNEYLLLEKCYFERAIEANHEKEEHMWRIIQKGMKHMRWCKGSYKN
jgi:hypothetical protein